MAVINGTTGADTLVGTTGDDTVNALAGNDRIDVSQGGSDLVNAGDGADVVFTSDTAGAGLTGADTVYLEGGNDQYNNNNPTNASQSLTSVSGTVVDGGTGNDTIAMTVAVGGTATVYGGDGADSIRLSDGDLLIYGGAGNDIVEYARRFNANETRQGNETLDGGTGVDSFYFYDPGIGATAVDISFTSADSGDFVRVGKQSGTFTSFESFYTANGADTIDASLATSNLLFNTLSGNDTVTSGSGNDTIDVGGGNDEVFGGDGDDNILGSSGLDTLYGGAGSDTIDGGSENDTIFGGDGADRLVGSVGADSVSGDLGDDTLTGDAGNDTLTGGVGNDIFLWDRASDDIITDFGVDDGGAGDGLTTNNDFVDLSPIYNSSTLAAYNAANGTSFAHAISAMNHDLADGVVNFNGTNMLGPTLTLTGVSGGLTVDQTGVACFVRGSLIITDFGECPIEDIRVGDKVLTRDNGYQAVRWIGKTSVTPEELVTYPHLRCVVIRKGALGNGIPHTDLRVSQQHKILVVSEIVNRVFGNREVLVASKKLVGLNGIEICEEYGEVEYWHLLFDQHEVIFSNGALTESLFTGPEAMKSLSLESVREIYDLFPELIEMNYNELIPARIVAKGPKLKKLIHRTIKNSKSISEYLQ